MHYSCRHDMQRWDDTRPWWIWRFLRNRAAWRGPLRCYRWLSLLGPGHTCRYRSPMAPASSVTSASREMLVMKQLGRCSTDTLSIKGADVSAHDWLEWESNVCMLKRSNCPWQCFEIKRVRSHMSIDYPLLLNHVTEKQRCNTFRSWFRYPRFGFCVSLTLSFIWSDQSFCYIYVSFVSLFA